MITMDTLTQAGVLVSDGIHGIGMFILVGTILMLIIMVITGDIILTDIIMDTIITITMQAITMDIMAYQVIEEPEDRLAIKQEP
jgi:hypothetical protein